MESLRSPQSCALALIMNKEIKHENLVGFIEANKDSQIDFAQYTYECGATDFVDQSYDFDPRVNKSVWSYKFNEFYLKLENIGYCQNFVIFIPEKAYLMYELTDDIFVWVCYTEESHRGKGYMTELLSYLKSKYTNKRVTVDTYNESLRELCIKTGINLFAR